MILVSNIQLRIVKSGMPYIDVSAQHARSHLNEKSTGSPRSLALSVLLSTPAYAGAGDCCVLPAELFVAAVLLVVVVVTLADVDALVVTSVTAAAVALYCTTTT